MLGKRACACGDFGFDTLLSSTLIEVFEAYVYH